ncbi:MAG: 4-(cytidine 5'-diphospho)-2-C-methyl-D-erythritol kinase [Deltaproteobacteria bacterium]|nr:4-(cytidine 5'-diphospho)-2-C-methyl-D-erythritol kinase [Deltaproteobacteria bacterium]
MHQELKVKSFAKLNLFLYVLDKREDGYHEIFSLLSKIDLHDILIFKRSNKITINSNIRELCGEKNVVYRVASFLKKRFDIDGGVEIYVDKHIPIGSGLGGESSNAAYTLLTLNTLWHLKMSREEMMKTSLLWGSDIPFFISANTALVKGRGELVYPLRMKKRCSALIVFPRIPIFTKDVYTGKIQLTNKVFVHRIAMDVFRKDDIDMKCILKYMHNDLEHSAFSLYPKLKQYKEKAEERLGRKLIMSGSGSAFFTILFEDEEVRRAVSKCKMEGIDCVKAKFLC